MEIFTVIDLKTTLGESPLWDEPTQCLWWADSFEGKLFRKNYSEALVRAWDVREKVGSFALTADGRGAVVALESGLYRFDLEKDELSLAFDPESDLPKNRLNDGKVDPRGRFVVGSMDTLEEKPSGRLYSWDPSGEIRVLDDGIICSNGPCWSPDGRTFYFADTWTGDIWAYDYDLDAGTVANRRVFARVDQSDGGACDGMTVDAEGFIWQAHVYGGKINRYDPDGTLERVIEMPVRKVTSVAFGGPQLDELFVTSMARPPLPRFPEDGPRRGSLFVVRGMEIPGLPTNRFGA